MEQRCSSATIQTQLSPFQGLDFHQVFFMSNLCFITIQIPAIYSNVRRHLTSAPLTNDVEPDGLTLRPNTVSLNGSITGHRLSLQCF